MLPDSLFFLPPKKRLPQLAELKKKSLQNIKDLEKKFNDLKAKEQRDLVEIENMIAHCLSEINEPLPATTENDNDDEYASPLPRKLKPIGILPSFKDSQTIVVDITSGVRKTPLKTSSSSTKSRSASHSSSSSQTITLDDIAKAISSSPDISPAPSTLPSEFTDPQYRRHLHETPIAYLRQNVEHLYHAIQDKGYLRWDEKELLEDISRALEEKMHDYHLGSYKPPGPITEHIDVTRKIANTILGRQRTNLNIPERNWYKGR